MGKIFDMLRKFNIIKNFKKDSPVALINSISEQEKQQENQDEYQPRFKKLPEFEVKGKNDAETMKNLVKLIGPTSGKYKLTKNQRSFQIKGRTVTALAGTLAIAGVTGLLIHVIGPQPLPPPISIEENKHLKDDLLKDVENTILKCALGEDIKDIKETASKCIFDDQGGGYSYSVWATDKFGNKKFVFTYSDCLFPDSVLNNKDIVSLMKNAIKVHESDNPSDKDLSNLNNSIETVNSQKYILDGNYIRKVKEIEEDKTQVTVSKNNTNKGFEH